jgi:hypothetical protein
MFKIEGDYSYIQTNTMQEYINGAPGLKVTVGVSPAFRSTIERFEKMEREWHEQKRLIEVNPAVKASWEQFQQMVQLAKEVQ